MSNEQIRESPKKESILGKRTAQEREEQEWDFSEASTKGTLASVKSTLYPSLKVQIVEAPS